VHTLDPDRFQIEALVTPELDQKIAVRLAGRRPCHGRESRAFGARPQACREERQELMFVGSFSAWISEMARGERAKWHSAPSPLPDAVQTSHPVSVMTRHRPKAHFSIKNPRNLNTIKYFIELGIKPPNSLPGAPLPNCNSASGLATRVRACTVAKFILIDAEAVFYLGRCQP
jgi:hypothetical protein